MVDGSTPRVLVDDVCGARVLGMADSFLDCACFQVKGKGGVDGSIVAQDSEDGWLVPSAGKTVVDSCATKGVECVAAALGRREKRFTLGHVFSLGVLEG